MMEYGKIFKKKYVTYVCGLDWNIHPSATLQWAGHFWTDILI
jgi:hypothetical protein